MATMNQLVYIILGILLLIAGYQFYQLYEKTGGRLEPIQNLLGDTDGDGIVDLQDDCPCTADNVKRDYQGVEYCVAEQDYQTLQEALDEYYRVGEGSDHFDDLGQQYLQVEPNEGSSLTLYTEELCEQALLDGRWPNRPGLSTDDD